MHPRFPSELALLLPANFNYVCLESMKITRIVFVGFRFSVANYFQVKKNCRHMYHIILFFLSFLLLQQLSPFVIVYELIRVQAIGPSIIPVAALQELIPSVRHVLLPVFVWIFEKRRFLVSDFRWPNSDCELG